jgi:hypothetical protein
MRQFTDPTPQSKASPSGRLRSVLHLSSFRGASTPSTPSTHSTTHSAVDTMKIYRTDRTDVRNLIFELKLDNEIRRDRMVSDRPEVNGSFPSGEHTRPSSEVMAYPYHTSYEISFRTFEAENVRSLKNVYLARSLIPRLLTRKLGTVG